MLFETGTVTVKYVVVKKLRAQTYASTPELYIASLFY